MKKNKKRRSHITLIEIMIVIVLIGLIGGALAFNMRGSLDQGKVFQTEQKLKRIEDILSIAEAQGTSLDEIASTWETIVADSPLADGAKTTTDGWKEKFTVLSNGKKIVVTSKKLPEKKS